MSKKLTTAVFIERAKEKHGDKYDYSKVDYVNSKEKVKITCFLHGDFEQIPNSHLMGSGCKKCGNLSNRYTIRKNTSYFIEQAKNKHGNTYCYKDTIYIKNYNRVSIRCKIHGLFKQRAAAHLAGNSGP